MDQLYFDRENVAELASAIICQTIKDWMFLMTSCGTRLNTKSTKTSYTEIRHFLLDGLGADLCDFLHLDSEYLMRILEKRLYDYETYGIMPPKIPKLDLEGENSWLL